MPEVDYYEILDVRPAATAAEIKAAYHRAVRTAHPDAGGTAGMFRLVNEAYRTLSDPQARAAYDAGVEQHGRNEPAQGAETPAEPGWGDEVRWEAGGGAQARRAEPRGASRTTKNLREEDIPDYGPSWSERWVGTPSGSAAARWGGWVAAALFGVLLAVLFLLPEWVRPADAGSDVLGFLLDHPPMLLAVVIVYAVAALFGFLGLLWLPMTMLHLGVFVVVVIGWPAAYWGLADSWERLAYVGVAAVWIVYAVAMTVVPLWQAARFRLDRAG